MADDAAKLQIVLEALVGEFKASLQQAVGVVQQSTTQMQGQVKTSTRQMEQSFKSMGSNITGSMKDMHGQVTGAISGIGSTIGKLAGIMAGVGAVLAGGAWFKKAIESYSDFIGEAKKTREAIGGNINDSAALNYAFKRVGMGADELQAIFFALRRQLHSNEEGMNRAGVVTRASGDQYRTYSDILLQGTKILRGIEDPTERSQKSVDIFGMRAKISGAALKVMADDVARAGDFLRSLGMTIGPEMEAQLFKYKSGMVDAGMVTMAVNFQIASVLLPTLTKLGKWFSGEGPALVRHTINAFNYLEETVIVLGTNWNILKIKTDVAWAGIKESIRGAVEYIKYAMEFNMDAANAAFEASLNRATKAAREGAENIKRATREGYTDAANVWAKPMAPGNPLWPLFGIQPRSPDADPSPKPKPKTGDGGGKSAKEEAQTVVTLFEQLAWGAEDAKKALALCDERLEKMRENSVRLLSGQEKYASTMAGLSPILSEQIKWKEIEIEKEIELKLASLDRELAEKKISQAIYDQEKGMIALTSQAKRYQLQMTGWETQGIGGGIKMLQMEMAKESGTRTAKDFVAGFKAMEAFAGDALSGFLKGALRGEKADLKKLGMSIADMFIDGMVKVFARTMFSSIFGFMASAWASTQATMTAASAAGESARLGITASGASQGMGILASLAKGTILIQAGQAAAGAFKSVMVSVPFPFNVVLAPIVAAAAFAATMAFGSGFGSGGGGAGTTNPSGGYSEGYHSGGVVAHQGMMVAHGGLRLDERMIKAQTGEWILNRDAAQALQRAGGPSTFDNLNSGMLPVMAGSGGGTVNTYHISTPVNQQVLQRLDYRELRRTARDNVRATEREMKRIGMK